MISTGAQNKTQKTPEGGGQLLPLKMLERLPYVHATMLVSVFLALCAREHLIVCVLPVVYSLMAGVTFAMNLLGQK